MSDYLSIEDLNMIAENPTTQTIKVLYNKHYNLEDEKKQSEASPSVNMQNEIIPPVSIPNVAPPVVGIPPVNNEQKNNVSVQNNLRAFEIPKIEVPIPSANNNLTEEPISFTGNIFEPQGSGMNNLMQTTDNFGAPSEVPSTNVPVNSGQFFGGNMMPEGNNPIPIYGGNQNPQRQTMFGQIQRDYTRAA